METGNLRGKVEKRIKKYGLDDKVILTGLVKNPYDYLSASDIFILPSKYEGLPLVGVEAQTNGLPTLLTENITKEIKITELVEYVKLTKEDWVNAIENTELKTFEERIFASKLAGNSIFNVEKVAEKLEKDYIEMQSKEV